MERTVRGSRLEVHRDEIKAIVARTMAEAALGVKVDVGTPETLRERLRDELLAEAITL